MNKRAILLGAALAMSASVAFAQDKQFDLRISHWVPPSHPLHKAMEAGARRSRRPRTARSVQGLSLPAARQGVRPLRHGARRHRRRRLCNPGYQPGRFPIIDAGNLPFLVSNAKGGSGAIDEWYRKHAEKEMKDVKFCFAFLHDPGHVPFQDQEDRRSGRREGHEDPPGARHRGDLDDAARRHQREWPRRRRCATSSRRASPKR